MVEKYPKVTRHKTFLCTIASPVVFPYFLSAINDKMKAVLFPQVFFEFSIATDALEVSSSTFVVIS